MTSAPRSPRSIAAYGPTWPMPQSMTRTPSKSIMVGLLSRGEVRSELEDSGCVRVQQFGLGLVAQTELAQLFEHLLAVVERDVGAPQHLVLTARVDEADQRGIP